jgi:N-acetyl-gamma-glutamyl-phosphate reductase
MYKIGIAGATGYTGVELLRILSRHPDVEIKTLTSETYKGKRVDEVFPTLRTFANQELVELGSHISEGLDILFLALPHTAAMDVVHRFLSRDCRIVDLSADYRLRNAQVFQEWYAVPHTQTELLKSAVYGLPELWRDAIKTANLVANPGCYPTSAILALAPLMQGGWIDVENIIVDSKSGVSGAGRKASQGTQYCEVNEGVSAYGAVRHRHTPEIEQEISVLAGKELQITFTPHLMPMTRGILSTVYCRLLKETTTEKLLKHYQDYYAGEPFVRILPAGQFANTRYVSGSNFCDIGLQIDHRNDRVVVTSAIDNLVKGASGQAVQNMNIMLGLDEKTGLDFAPAFP